MTDTVLSSATREVVIGFGRPFVMIGERINPTGRKLLAEEMKTGDFSRVEADALAQVAAGAHMLDVNAGIPLADEPAMLARAISSCSRSPTCRCRSTRRSSRRSKPGLAVYKGKPLVNSVTGEDEVLERVMPLVAKYGAAVVAISNDETGISMDPDVRFAVAKRIVERAADFGIPAADVVVDPLVMPIGALGQAGQHAFQLIRRLREELKVNTICGASNVSFGLPNRHSVTGTFLAMAIGAGMTSAIMNPMHPEVKAAVHGRRRAGWARTRTARPGSAPTAIPHAEAHPTSARAGAADGSEYDPMPRPIVFTPSGLTRRGRHRHDGARAAARQLGVDLDTVCGGRGICGRCQVVPRIGSVRQVGDHQRGDGADRLASIEIDYEARASPRHCVRRAPPRLRGRSSRRRRDRRPAESQVHRQVVRKIGRPHRAGRSIRVHAALRRRRRRPSSATPSRCTELIGEAVAAQHGASVRDVRAPACCAPLHKAAANDQGSATVAVDVDGVGRRASGRASSTRAFGVAVDVGSTTVAGHLCDLTTRRGARDAPAG